MMSPCAASGGPATDPAHRRYRLEFGLKAEGAACAQFDAAWQYAVTQLHAIAPLL